MKEHTNTRACSVDANSELIPFVSLVPNNTLLLMLALVTSLQGYYNIYSISLRAANRNSLYVQTRHTIDEELAARTGRRLLLQQMESGLGIGYEFGDDVDSGADR